MKAKAALNEQEEVQRLAIRLKPKETMYLIYGDGQLYNLHNLVKGSKMVVITVKEVK